MILILNSHATKCQLKCKLQSRSCASGNHDDEDEDDDDNNNNNNNYDNVYGAIIMTKVTAKVHPVHLMNVD